MPPKFSKQNEDPKDPVDQLEELIREAIDGKSKDVALGIIEEFIDKVGELRDEVEESEDDEIETDD